MVSENIVKSPIKSTEFVPIITLLKRQWSTIDVSPADPRLNSTYNRIKEYWLQSQLKVGQIDDMKLRSDIFKKLYLQNPGFFFGISTAHLTLGIDRFASMSTQLKQNHPWLRENKMLKDLSVWGKELRRINQKMTQLVLFSKNIYDLNKEIELHKIIGATISDRPLFKDLTEIISLIPLWKSSDVSDQESQLILTADKFIEWEHYQIIQPRLEKALLKVNERFEKDAQKNPWKIFRKQF